MNPAADRLLVLDATRGFAVMGILLINIIAFSMPQAAYVNPMAWGGQSIADMAVWTINQILFEGRMRGLFALLFGASMLLVMDRAARDGRSPVAVHLSRMIVLAMLGAAHHILIWDGDILLLYACCGAFLWIGRGASPRTLVLVGAACIAIVTAQFSIRFGDALLAQNAVESGTATAEQTERVQRMLARLPGPSAPSNAADLDHYRSGYGAIVTARAEAFYAGFFGLVRQLGLETLGYMLIGMALFRSGLFAGRWSDDQVRRLAVACYALSLPVLAAQTWWAFAGDFNPIYLLGSFLGWSVPFRVLCAIGHVALAVLLVRRFATSAIVDRVAAVGRMALSNYLASSLVMTTIFYGYGLNLFSEVARAPVYLFVLAMWTAMLLWSRPWLDRFRFGPVEWLWRTLSRRRLQPMRAAA